MAQPLLGRCKSCDYAIFATDEDVIPAEDLNEVRPGGVFKMASGGYLSRCDQRHYAFKLKRIEGTYSEDFKCDSRCLNAKGHVCKCSCGGANHGRGYAAQVYVGAGPRISVGGTESMTPVEAANVAEVHRLAQRETRSRHDTEPEVKRGLRVHLGEEGEKVYGECRVIAKKSLADSILYTFAFIGELHAVIGADVPNAIIKWFCPSYADPDFDLGDEMKFKAKVKKHEDNEYGRATLVTYFEEV